MESENETMSLDIEKMEKYLAGLANHNATKEANLKVLTDELQQKSMSLEISSIIILDCLVKNFDAAGEVQSVSG